MSGIQYLACLWTLLITQSGFVCCDIQFLELHEGDSVVFACAIEQSTRSPFGVYLKRSWLHPGEVLYMYTQTDFHTNIGLDKNRTSVSGDPSSHSVNVTISQLTVRDTDRYYCEFLVENKSSEDERMPGKTEFFLLVSADVPERVDRGWVETCAGGSVVLPCLPAHGEGPAVEGVILKRQRGRAPVEVLYHSKRHHGNGPRTSSQSPSERFLLSTATGPGGITYNLTLQQLQPEDSALYSCQLLQLGRPDSSTSLGRQVFFVSVQGDQPSTKTTATFNNNNEGQCNCSSSSILLYVLSSALAVLILLGLLGIYLCKGRRSVKSHPQQAAIYEEMTGVQPLSRKLAPRHLEDMESEYRNCSVKKSCPENHYESPSGALCPRNGIMN